MEIISHELMALFLFLVLAVLLILGFPVALTLAGTSIIFAYLGYLLDLFPVILLGVLPNRIFSIVTNETLIAVPLFIFMGVMMKKSGVVDSLLINLSKVWGGKKGGLAYSTLFVGMLMAASTGIVGATVVTMGVLSLPLMMKWGYDKKISTGIICASGTLGQIIPPSIVLVLLADILQGANEQAAQIKGDLAPDPVSSIDLFSGAIFPGLTLVFLYGIWVFIYSRIKLNAFPIPRHISDEVIEIKEIFKLIIAPITLIFVVLGSILLGIATPTESAALGAIGSLIIAKIQKKIGVEGIHDVSIESLKITSMVFFILIGASLFSLVFRGFGGDRIVEDFLTNIPGGPTYSLFLVMITIFIIGFFLDFLEIIFVIIPIVAPSLIAMGFDPIWLGIMIAINIQTSFLTPPFGFALFYLRGVASKEIKTSAIYRGVMPFIALQLLLILLMYFFPNIITWLPSQL